MRANTAQSSSLFCKSSNSISPRTPPNSRIISARSPGCLYFIDLSHKSRKVPYSTWKSPIASPREFWKRGARSLSMSAVPSSRATASSESYTPFGALSAREMNPHAARITPAASSAPSLRGAAAYFLRSPSMYAASAGLFTYPRGLRQCATASRSADKKTRAAANLYLRESFATIRRALQTADKTAATARRKRRSFPPRLLPRLTAPPAFCGRGRFRARSRVFRACPSWS